MSTDRRWIPNHNNGEDEAFREFLDPIIDEAERRIREHLPTKAEASGTNDKIRKYGGSYGPYEAKPITPENVDRLLERISYKINWRRRKLRTYASASPSRLNVRFNHIFVRKAIHSEGMFGDMNMEGRERFAFLLDTVLHEIAHILQPHLLGSKSGHGNDWRWMARAVGAVPIGCTNVRKRLRKIRRNLLEEGEELKKKAAASAPAPPKKKAHSGAKTGNASAWARGVLLRLGRPSDWDDTTRDIIADDARSRFPNHKALNDDPISYIRLNLKKARDAFRDSGWKLNKRGRWYARFLDEHGREGR